MVWLQGRCLLQSPCAQLCFEAGEFLGVGIRCRILVNSELIWLSLLCFSLYLYSEAFTSLRYLFPVALGKITSGILLLKKYWEVCTSLTATQHHLSLQQHLCSFCYFKNADHSWLLLRLLSVHCLPKAIWFHFCHCQLQQNPLSSWFTNWALFPSKGCSKELGSLANWVDYRSDTWVMSLTPTCRWWYCQILYIWLDEQRPSEKQRILKTLQLASFIYCSNHLSGKRVSILFLKRQVVDSSMAEVSCKLMRNKLWQCLIFPYYQHKAIYQPVCAIEKL